MLIYNIEYSIFIDMLMEDLNIVTCLLIYILFAHIMC